MSNSLCGDNGDGSCSVGDRNTKKVRFKETDSRSDPEMKEKLFGKRLHDQKGGVKWLVLKRMMILLFLDGDIKRSSVNGVPSIEFLDRTTEFNLAQPYPNVVMTLIKSPGLPGHLYKKRILWEISGMVGKIAKLDFNTDSKARGKYARMAVYVNLGKPLLSQVLINGNIQRIEYESLPVAKEVVTTPVGKNLTADMAMADAGTVVDEGPFGPWMIME
ncbi:hypothetical protein GOBAR_DD14689 [Gossypium barbadense]|nr:hypothetical protein GOBAR_DD14689 [Gossypium barbadense]